ncbi:MAG: hypothetical protein WKF84_30350 [Pyrinomonadaceae bacterium]
MIEEEGVNNARFKVLEGLAATASDLQPSAICVEKSLQEADRAKFELLMETLDTLQRRGT